MAYSAILKERLRADNRRSIEGSLAMFISSFISVLFVLLIRDGIYPIGCLTVAFSASIVCTVVEMCTKSGLDTAICPISAMLVVLPLVTLFGG